MCGQTNWDTRLKDVIFFNNSSKPFRYVISGARFLLWNSRTEKSDARISYIGEGDVSVHVRSRQQQRDVSRRWTTARNHILHMIFFSPLRFWCLWFVCLFVPGVKVKVPWVEVIVNQRIVIVWIWNQWFDLLCRNRISLFVVNLRKDIRRSCLLAWCCPETGNFNFLSLWGKSQVPQCRTSSTNNSLKACVANSCQQISVFFRELSCTRFTAESRSSLVFSVRIYVNMLLCFRTTE